MKKKMIAFVLLVSAFVIGIIFTPRIAHAVALDDGDVIKCKCTLGGKCRANGGSSTCAQSQPGGNIDCSTWDGNCAIGN